MALAGGILSIFGIYFLTKEFFNRQIGFLAAFLLAVSSWHFNLSVIDSSLVWSPFLLITALLFLWRGLKGRHIQNFALSGLFFGIGVFLDPFFKIFSLVIAAGVLSHQWSVKKDYSHNKYEGLREYILRGIVLFSVVTLIIVLPLIILNIKNLPEINLISIKDKATISLPVTVLFLTGLFKSFIKLFKKLKTHGHISAIHLVLISWLFIGFFSWEAVAALPVIIILAAEGCWWLFSWLENWYSAYDKHSHEASFVSKLVLTIFLISVALVEIRQFIIF